MVKRVGQRLASSVEAYLRNNGMAGELSQYAWEFNLVQDKSANAFCLPGGKIVVYEGLLPYTQNEAALAIVLGHELPMPWPSTAQNRYLRSIASSMPRR